MEMIGTPGSVPATVQTVSPTTGQTVSMSDTSANSCLWITPAGTLNSLTVNLPSNANSILGQVVSLGSQQVITTLTVQNAGTIFNNLTSLAIGDLYAFKKVASNTWARFSQ